MTGLVGWLVQARQPAELLDQIVVTDEDQDGKVLASRHLPHDAGPTVRDLALRQLGFQRVDYWLQAPGGLRCKVERR